MQKLLIANRGEIARRVIASAHRLGIPTVALATERDRDALHAREASEVVRIGNYLDIDAIVTAAAQTGADAVHPGYGFLSERAEFARKLEAAGIALLGPSTDVMDRMGRKDHAREIAVQAGVPVVPSYAVTDEPEAMAYPVLVKAAAGGGGKGMRVVRAAAELADAITAAAREALSAFGDGTLLIEKYVERGRHIEVQVFGDTHGNVVHFYERDCSTQRRHQKVLEEAPAPTIDDQQREAITSAAVRLAAQVGYVGAGTVEFLLDANTGEFYFLEMNTRLQVEHPVSEAIARVRGDLVDLVELQIRIADGEALGFVQSDVSFEGHAIEARVYAEDPYAGFLPQAGLATQVIWPESIAFEPTADGLRIDHSLESRQRISTAYDPMLGKVIAAGVDRESARQQLVTALDGSVVFGMNTNLGFLRFLLASDAFRDAVIDTAWLDRVEIADLGAPDEVSTNSARKLAAAGIAATLQQTGPFAADGWRSTGGKQPLRIKLDEPTLVEPAVGGHVRITERGAEVVLRGQRFVFEQPDPFSSDHRQDSDGLVRAPMPGAVVAVNVARGEKVEAGQVLGSMEAMKMELSLKAPIDGIVTEVNAVAGSQVTMGATLFVVEPDDA
ncbi:MAG TPA: biotin carboxylase N-terminal domain-containing protein [Marmoricola sp.]|nr:biotin carboxylase N-terminal domain-containing protein [Marmoricola sp.]